VGGGWLPLTFHPLNQPQTRAEEGVCGAVRPRVIEKSMPRLKGLFGVRAHKAEAEQECGSVVNEGV